MWISIGIPLLINFFCLVGLFVWSKRGDKERPVSGSVVVDLSFREQQQVLRFIELHNGTISQFLSHALSVEKFSPQQLIGNGRPSPPPSLRMLRQLVQDDALDLQLTAAQDRPVIQSLIVMRFILHQMATTSSLSNHEKKEYAAANQLLVEFEQILSNRPAASAPSTAVASSDPLWIHMWSEYKCGQRQRENRANAPANTSFPLVQPRICLASIQSRPFTLVRVQFEYVARYTQTVRKNYYVPHTESKNDLRSVVVGAGPVGLSSALELYRSGSATVVIEQRTDYTRSIWFDLYPSPWADSLDLLHRVGVDDQLLEIQTHPNDGLIFTVRAQMLERSLAKAAYLSGVELVYGQQFDGIEQTRLARGDGDQFVLFATTTAGQLYPFNVMVGADGPSSRSRATLNIPFKRQTDFLFANQELPRTISNLHQPTTLVFFKPDPSNKKSHCPKIATIDGDEVDARYPGLFLDSVVNVFKRFYHGHCHLQILWSKQAGEKITQNWQHYEQQNSPDWQDKAIPWSQLFEIAQIIFFNPPTSINQLKRKLAVSLLNVKIFASFNSTFSLQPDLFPETRANYRDRLIADDGSAINPYVHMYTLAGDALFTANYRLGIGINSGISATKDLSSLIDNLTKANNSMDLIEKAVVDKKNVAEQRLRDLLQYQLSLMFYETYCSFFIMFDASQENLFHTPQVYGKRKNKAKRGRFFNFYQWGPFTDEEKVLHCEFDQPTNRDHERIMESIDSELLFDEQLQKIMKIG